MSKARRKRAVHPPDDRGFAVRRRTPIPHEFVLEPMEPASLITRPMFGCLAVYVQEKIVFILRDKADSPTDNGVWLATTEKHYDSLRRESFRTCDRFACSRKP